MKSIVVIGSALLWAMIDGRRNPFHAANDISWPLILFYDTRVQRRPSSQSEVRHSLAHHPTRLARPMPAFTLLERPRLDSYASV